MSSDDVTQLVLRERQSRDRGWYGEMADCFADDSIVQMSWFTGSGADFVRQTRAMAGRGDYAVHRLSPPAERIDGDRALAELPLMIEWRIDIDGVEADLASACRSQYRAERGADGIWRIARITSIYEKDTLVPVLPGTRLAVDPGELTRYRPSYRFLAWYLNRKGYTVGDHHLGDDQPVAVTGQYRAEHTWLHQGPTPAASAGTRKEHHS
ncbi:nuclear transport factor 2 family protein [Streptomyces gibsoniae]|uniref:Nuclear transport factor 2 family protein n=1 Tax=Streptomyces gibsoniae TaxID=3075529 RepID=A0ABU2TWV4_9ACTN|nr:nuclear transport factor 2 family protein [Streptomyces sp. DSM 41699]MDT0465399.1 nuclear transport factor 2 family protein [Streptomyces sp. DSM 41699]